MHEAPCPGCSSTDTRDLGRIPPGHTFAGRQLDTLIEGGRLLRCEDCHLGFRYPRLDKAHYADLYQAATDQTWQYETSERADWRRAADWLTERVPAGKVLDIGCFDGGFLMSLPDRYSKGGIEINADARTRAAERGIHILAQDIESLPKGQPVADAVFAFDLAEHVFNPAALLESMVSLVRPGGIVVLSTGNLDARTWRFMGSRYWYCTLAEHVSFLSPRWCEWAAKEMGLTLIAVRTFAHDSSASPVQKGREALGNMLFRTAPTLLRGMRQLGFGGLDVRANPELATIPPPWPSARDHFITLFRRM
jgi:2-polyprenyl-3-methyl-5-hydroxy-6-metoxy-1,4-benzoquinol methylase